MKLIHILLTLTILLCSIGIASAANLTLFDDENMANAETTLQESGIGDLFALISMVVVIVIWISPVVLLLTALIALALNKRDVYKFAAVGFLLMVAVLVVYNLFIAYMSAMTPDISTLEF